MDFKLKTLTPIWTGDHKTKCDKIKSSGLTGSIRWWYECIIRGLGGNACDPTENKCSYDSSDNNDTKDKIKILIENQIISDDKEAWKAGFYKLSQDRNTLEPCVCEVCKLFGCNGWAKTFRIQIKNDSNMKQEGNRETFIKIKSNKGYMLPLGLEGNFTLRVLPTRDIDAAKKVGTAILLALNHGALGAKTHLGYGVLEFKDQQEQKKIKDQILSESVIHSIVSDFSYKFENGSYQKNENETYDKYPVLTDFIFARVNLSNGNNAINTPLEFRYNFRNALRDNTRLGCTVEECLQLRHYFCGDSTSVSRGDSTLLSKISSHQFASRAYQYGNNWEMRTYAWFPDVLNQFNANAKTNTRNTFMNVISNIRNFNSNIITYTVGTDDRIQWIKALIQ